ncbi:MAG: hypothetical protein LBQ51_10255 [Desulfovibrio sp.]|jgi:hypothetical protein|nr:hypothetical protein [Desulfovibrio sp.]
MRTLVFGPMPENADPATHIAAGVWCFAGRETLFPNWDGSRGGTEGLFPLPPDPYADAHATAEAAASADAEVLRLCRKLEAQNPWRGERFFLTAFGPFFLLAAHMLAERHQRLLDLIALYGEQTLCADVLPEGAFSFRDSLDFMVRGVQDSLFNHYVYSRMLEYMAPPVWELRPVSPAPALPRADDAPSDPLPARLRASLRRALLRLPFPPLKGFGLSGALLLSPAVLLNRESDATLDFSLCCSSPPLWHFPAEDLIMRCLPPLLAREAAHLPASARPAVSGLPSASDNPSAPAHPSRPYIPDSTSVSARPSVRSSRTPLRGISPAYAQDDVYRLRLARLGERGVRFFSVQHGANYGNLLSIGGLPFEYSLHAFFTWGWNAHPGCAVNARPMLHPVPAALAGRHKEQRPALILVGTEMSAFSYRLKSRPQSGALPAYRAAKTSFLGKVRAGLKSAPDAVVMYRPYFRAAGALDDGEHVFGLLPDIRPCTGDLTAHMLACRLIVLDHYGTTLHCALAADTPTLAFWKRADWGMDRQSSAALDTLAAAGILHETPEDAAAQALAVWGRIEDWWHSPRVRKARRVWLDSYAWIDIPIGAGGDLKGVRPLTPPREITTRYCPPSLRSGRTGPGPTYCAKAVAAADELAAGLGPEEARPRIRLGCFELLRCWFRSLRTI